MIKQKLGLRGVHFDFNKSKIVPSTDLARYRDKKQPLLLLDESTGTRSIVWGELDANATTSASRNLIIGPGSKLLNAQISRDLRLGGNRVITAQLNGNNLLNMVNYAGIDTVVNSPTLKP